MKSFYFSKFNFLLESMENEQKVALIPGSFKPPHKGHYVMIEHYSKLVGPNGKVIVFVSKPSAKNARKTKDGKIIEPETVKQILDIFCKNLGNVEVEVSQVSPVKSCYDIGERLDSGVLIFGCSKKGDDIKRFKQIKQYIESRNPNLIVLDPLTTAVDVTSSGDNAVSATDFREAFDDPKRMIEFLPDHLNDGTKEQIINILLH
jgi:nicotinic acid mononucleotide adenylyltransferase